MGHTVTNTHLISIYDYGALICTRYWLILVLQKSCIAQFFGKISNKKVIATITWKKMIIYHNEGHCS